MPKGRSNGSGSLILVLAARYALRYTLNVRVYLETLGCRLNYAEMSSLSRQLIEAGHVIASSADDAELCVLNSCAVTDEAVRKSRQLARHIARVNPNARLVVTGCDATLEGEAVAALPNVALVVSNRYKDELLAMIRDRAATLPGEAGALAGPSPSRDPSEDGVCALPVTGRTRAFVKVQDGCRNHCTFCIVRVARGAERSQPIGVVVDEVNRLHAEGYQEAVLTGVHLGGYGQDRGENLRSLLGALLQHSDMPRLRLSSLEPFDLSPDLFELWTEWPHRLMPHLHLPAQSGSDAILRRMARRNSVASFEGLAAAARAAIPGLMISTDLIAGFPGETEADFEETGAFAERVGFAHLHVFPYSARVGTPAARFDGQVPEGIRRRRCQIFKELDKKLGRLARARLAGQTRSVLWESRAPRSEPGLDLRLDSRTLGNDGDTCWSGLTDNYVRVWAPAPAGLDLHNHISDAKLLRNAGEGLLAEIVHRE